MSSPTSARTTRIAWTSLAICSFGFVEAAFGAAFAAQNPEQASAGFDGEKTDWHGFERFDYVMDEASFAITPFRRPDSEKFGVSNPPKGQRRSIIVVPKQAAPGHPWSWQGCYWDHEPQTEVELLRRGFHIAFITPANGASQASPSLCPGRLRPEN